VGLIVAVGEEVEVVVEVGDGVGVAGTVGVYVSGWKGVWVGIGGAVGVLDRTTWLPAPSMTSAGS
jgi:hypothetical protein